MSRGKEVLEVLGEVLGALSVGHAEGFVGFLRVHTVDGEGVSTQSPVTYVGFPIQIRKRALEIKTSA